MTTERRRLARANKREFTGRSRQEYAGTGAEIGKQPTEVEFVTQYWYLSRSEESSQRCFIRSTDPPHRTFLDGLLDDLLLISHSGNYRTSRAIPKTFARPM